MSYSFKDTSSDEGKDKKDKPLTHKGKVVTDSQKALLENFGASFKKDKEPPSGGMGKLGAMMLGKTAS
jgi:hypothetical protein